MPEVTARVDRKTKARLEKLAKTTRRTISALTAEAVRSYIDIQEWQIAGIKHGIKEADAGNFATGEELEATLQKWRRRAQEPVGAADRRRSHAFPRRAQ
jgi:RHH-type rel operon transcriptional repressor/antitoxin RelB